MAIPELDLKKVNLQAAVGYLISLHDNEVDWNLLGIKVIGHIDALPIPEGTYEYGDAYMVGTETPYDMYIYTRPDGTVHTEGYWFPVGKFPMPGQQGPKGDGVETLRMINTGRATSASYDIINGISTNSDATIEYIDSTTGESKSQTVSLYAKTPILPGKYISIDNRDSRNVEIGVDDTALALDYIKIDKTKNAVAPLFLGGSINWSKVTESTAPNSIAYRDANGNSHFNKVDLAPAGFTVDGNKFDKTVMVYGLKSDVNIIDQTGGTLTSNEAHVLNTTAVCRLKIQDKVYYRVSEFGKVPVRFMSCDSTGNIYVLTCDTTNKTYTISTLASQATGIYRHGIVMYGSPFNIYIDIYDSNSAAYTYSALKTKLATEPSYTAVAHITGEDGTHISAALVHYNTSLDNYTIMYHNIQNQTTQVNWTPTQVVDNGTPIYNA